MTDALAAVPREAGEAARSTLAGAVAVAGELPGVLGVDLLDAAREAFGRSLQVAAAVSATILVAMAIVVATRLRRSAMPQPGGRRIGWSKAATPDATQSRSLPESEHKGHWVLAWEGFPEEIVAEDTRRCRWMSGQG